MSTKTGEVQIAVYDGTPTCSFSTEVPRCALSIAPVAIPPSLSLQVADEKENTAASTSASSVISGTAWLYRATQMTMTVHLTAQSSIGNVTDMLIWSDTLSNTVWQPFAPFVWLPTSNFVFARFRDGAGNLSEIYSDTTIPSAPPVPLDPNYSYMPMIRKQ